MLDAEVTPSHYHLPDRSVGEAGGANPLETLSWQDLREEIYGDPRPCVYEFISVVTNSRIWRSVASTPD